MVFGVYRSLGELFKGHDWLQELSFNLLSYALFLIPIALFVTAVRKNFCLFSAFKDLYFVKLFVYGKEKGESESMHSIAVPPPGIELETKSKSKWTFRQLTLFIYCFVGLQASFLTYGILQEKIMTTEYIVGPVRVSIPANLTQGTELTVVRFREVQFLVFLNRTATFILALIAVLGKGIIELLHPKEKRRYAIAPSYEFIYCALSNILSSWCQNEALKYVNYPTQVLSKSCKIVPVMLMSKILDKKSYPWSDYVIAVVVSTGVAVFLFGTERRTPSGSWDQTKVVDGVAILVLFLTFDSFSSNWQGKLFKKYKISSLQLMLSASFYSVLLTLSSLTEQRNFFPAFNLLLVSEELTRDCFLFACSSAVGQLFTYYTISVFGPVVFVTIMTVRQALSILLSCLTYHHSLTLLSISGLAIVFPVLFIQIYMKYTKRKQ